MRKLMLTLAVFGGSLAALAAAHPRQMLSGGGDGGRHITHRRIIYPGVYSSYYSYPASYTPYYSSYYYSPTYYAPAYSSYYTPAYSSYYYTPAYNYFAPAYRSFYNYYAPAYRSFYNYYTPAYSSSYYFPGVYPGMYIWP